MNAIFIYPMDCQVNAVSIIQIKNKIISIVSFLIDFKNMFVDRKIK